VTIEAPHYPRASQATGERRTIGTEPNVGIVTDAARPSTKETPPETRNAEAARLASRVLRRSRAEIRLRLYSGPRQHFITFKRTMDKDVISVDGESVREEKALQNETFSITDKNGQIQVSFKSIPSTPAGAFWGGATSQDTPR